MLPSTARSQPAPSPPVCDRHEVLIDHLAARYDEVPLAMGLVVDGTVLEVLVSPSGTWSLLVTLPSGLTCLLRAGSYWESWDPPVEPDSPT